MKEQTQNKTRKKSPARFLVPLLVLFACAIVLVIFIPSVSRQPIVGNVLKKLGITSHAESSGVHPSVVIGAQEKANDNSADTVSIGREVPAPAEKVVSEKIDNTAGRFYLIAGSFKDLKNAEKLSTRLTLEGYRTEILSTPDGWHRVSVMLFTNREQALKALNELKSSGKLSTVWLLSI